MSDEQKIFYDETAVRGEFAKVPDGDLERVVQWARAEQQKRKPNMADPAVIAARHADNNAEMKKMAAMTEAELAAYRAKQYGF